MESAYHCYHGFHPLAIVYALPIAFLMWAILTFAGAIALYCLIAVLSCDLAGRYSRQFRWQAAGTTLKE